MADVSTKRILDVLGHAIELAQNELESSRCCPRRGKKCFALVKARYLSNDGWKNIRGFEDHFEVDAKNPRVVVEILGADETDGV